MTGRALRPPDRTGPQTVAAAGQTVDYRSFPTMGHSMHGQDPTLFTETLVDWVSSLRPGS